MKKSFKCFYMAVLSMLAIASCTAEPIVEPDQPISGNVEEPQSEPEAEPEPQPEPGPGPVGGIIQVSAEAIGESPVSSSTRTAIVDGAGSEKTVVWELGDEINIIYGTDPENRVCSATERAGEHALFHFEVPAEATSLYAVTPSAIGGSVEEGTLYVSVPKTQDGSFASAHIAVAKVAAAEDVVFNFKNMTSFFKVTTTDAGITKLELTANGGENIAGVLAVNFDKDNVPSPGATSYGASSITVNLSDAGTHYISVFPGVTFSEGFRLNVYKGDALETAIDFNQASDLTLARSQVANFGTITVEFIGAGLTDLYATATGGTGKYYTTQAFPYSPGDPISVHIPNATAAMLASTTMHPTLASGNRIYPALPTDYTTTHTMMVRDSKGHFYTHNLSIDTRAATFTKVFEKNATQMNLTWTNRMRIAADEDYVYVLDAVENYCQGIRVINRKTGAFVTTMSAPYDNEYVCLGDINIDDGGNLVVTRYNFANGCGMLAKRYDESTSSWVQFVYYAGEQVPASLGEYVSICGNCKTGSAILYATAPSLNKVYHWDISNGVASSPVIEDVSIASLTQPWSRAAVYRPSVASGAPVYLGINRSDSNAAFFRHFGESDSIYGTNTNERILNIKTFTFKNEEYLAMVFQKSASIGSLAFLRVFNITDRSRWPMAYTDASGRWDDDFCITEKGGFGGANYSYSAGVDVVTDDDAAYIYIACPCKGSGDPTADAANSVLVCYKMEFK